MTRDEKLAWRMVATVLAANICSMGLVSGSFGLVMPLLETEMGVSRTAIAGMFSLMLVTLGFSAPIVGNLLQTVPVRKSMMIGTSLNGMSFLALAFIDNYYVAAVLFGLGVGAGSCLLSVIPGPTLIGRWFVRNRGKALGLAMMPIGIGLVPPLAAALIEAGGRQLLFIGIAAAYFLLLPVLITVVERPSGAETSGGIAVPPPVPSPIRARDLLRDYRFWLLMFGIGILTGAASVYVSQAAAMAMQKGFDLKTASLFVSAYGFGSVFGALLYGWLIDRVGAVPTFVLSIVVDGLLFFLHPELGSFAALIAVSLGIGLGAGGLVALHASVIVGIYGVEALSKVMGYGYVGKVPFLLFSAPAVAWAFERTGSYSLPMRAVAMALFLSAMVMLALYFSERRAAGLRTNSRVGAVGGPGPACE